MVGELGGDGMRQKTRATQRTCQRTHFGGTGCLQTLLGRHPFRVAMPASVALLDRAYDKKTRRFQVQLFGRLLPDADTRPSTAGAELFGLGQVVNDLPAFQRLGQGSSTMRFGPARLVLLGIPSRELAFRTPTEAMLQGGIQLTTQLGVLGT